MQFYDRISKFIRNNLFYSQSPEYRDASTFYQFPILTKDMVLRHQDWFCPKESSLYVAHTSGSTGTPLSIAWDKNDYLKSMACLWRLRKENGVLPTDFYLTCHNVAFNRDLVTKDRFIITDNFLSLSKLYSNDEYFEQCLNYIKIFNPKWIYAQPSFVYQLGLFIQKRDPELLNRFFYVELVGEMVDPLIKDNIKLLFSNAKVVVMYGMQEFNCIMYEKNNALQLCEENVFVELLNSDGVECSLYEEGDIVVTGLKNSKFPLIRYFTGDRAMKIIDNNLLAYKITQGRANDFFIYQNQIFDGSIFFYVVLKYNAVAEKKIARFQAVQYGEQINLSLFGFSNLSDENYIRHKLQEILYEDFRIDIPIAIEVVDDFSQFISNAGKTKYFIRKK